MFEIINNQLYIDGFSTAELLNEYGSPLYVYSEKKIIEQLNEIKNSFTKKYPNTHAAYACKAFCTLYMCDLLKREDFWLDVVSGGELYTALKAKFPAEKIEFNGNNKSKEELEMALDNNIGRIVIDNISEMHNLEKLCKEKNKSIKVLFRITPGIMSDTHEYITTGKKDSKFGIPLDENILYPSIENAIKSEFLDFIGFHFHVGSQLNDTNSHLAALDVILKLILETKLRFNYDIRDFNMGGGFGIKYTDEDKPLTISEFVDPMMNRISQFCTENSLKIPDVSMEPGRFIIGESGVQIYTIGNIKDIPNVRKYISVDGGMTDNLRPGLYGAKYDGVIGNKAGKEKDTLVSVSGKCCESTDILIKDFKCANPESGDHLVVFSTGAYGYSMANNYNKNPIPAVVMLRENDSKLIVKRQTYDTMTMNELL